nr:MAG TPA: hypothetical protein [Crassvirales sp.]
MAKKIRKRRANYFDVGGFSWQKGAGFGKNMSNAFNSGALSGTIGAASSIAGQGISGGLSSGVGNAMQGLGSIASAIPGPWGAVAGAGLNIVGGVVNRLFGSQINEQAIANFRNQNSQQSNTTFNASTTNDLVSQGNFGLLDSIDQDEVGKDGLFSDKASKLTEELNRQRAMANNQIIANYRTAAENVDTQNDLNALANYAAYGGPLTMRYTGTMSPFGNTFADGGNIHIKPSKRGTFTAAAKKHGKSVQSFASQVLANKENYSPAMVKKANFARNAAKWHSFGGDLNTNGGDFSNGLIMIGNGGTHEENPMEGVQMGMDAQGIPNLVEEGEVIFNDYVFSDRMNVPNSMRSSLGLSKGKNLTFAKAAKKLSKEAEERPNDPISRRGLLDSMSKLQQVQESLRQQDQEGNSGVQYAHGGRMGILFDGPGPDANFLNLSRRAHLFGDSVPDQTSTTAPSIYDNNGILTPEGLTYSRASHLGVPIEDIQAAESINKGTNDEPNDKRFDLTALRYAPVIGAAIGLGQNIFSKPDYSSSDAILNAASEAGRYTPVGFNPLGDYLTYRPFDRNYYINKLNAQSGATRRAIINQSAGNRATALAGLLAADYNAQGKLGDLARQAEEYNLGQRERVAAFNRGTNQFNSEMGLKAAMANQETALKARSQRLSGVAQAMAVRDAVDARRGASMSANLTNLFNSLGDIGREEYSRNMIMSNPALYYSIDDEGKITYKNDYEDLSEAEKSIVREEANKASKAKNKNKKAKGGYLTIKKK